MGTHEKLKQFMEEVNYIDQFAISGLIGISAPVLSDYLRGKGINSGPISGRVKQFLDTTGKELIEIHKSLRNGAKNRIELHRRRVEILKFCNHEG